MEIFKKIEAFYEQKLPFVVYRKPNEKNVNGLFCKDDTLFYTNHFSESGFVFAPFNNSQKAVLFPIDSLDIIIEEFSGIETIKDKKKQVTSISSKENYINLINKTIAKIRNNYVKKIVISRCEEVNVNNFNSIEIYKHLLEKYTSAFVYVWYHPKVGLWFGATPETLLEVDHNSFKTMSLAGTQVYKNNSNVFWGNKEIEEQQLVTDFIENQIHDITDKRTIGKAKTIRAGSLLHLKSKVEGELKKSSSLKSLLEALHPTPAVCGLPREEAKQFILENESYNRTFYTGFLGELNMGLNTKSNKKSHLFVNLRCMSIANGRAKIYVGGGITKDSIAEKEWEETVSKTSTMKSVL